MRAVSEVSLSPAPVPSYAMTHTNADLLAAASIGDQRAWDQIVDRYGRLLWHVVRSFRFDEGTAADVVQTTWLRLVEHLDRIKRPERLSSWLATTARNEAIHTMKRRGRFVPSEFDTDIVDLTADPLDTALLADERDAHVAAAFNRLAPECQMLLRLTLADPPLDYDVISEMIGRPKGSIGPTRRRCLEKISRYLGDHGVLT